MATGLTPEFYLERSLKIKWLHSVAGSGWHKGFDVSKTRNSRREEVGGEKQDRCSLLTQPPELEVHRGTAVPGGLNLGGGHGRPIFCSYISGAPRKSIIPLTQGLKESKKVVETGFPRSHLASEFPTTSAPMTHVGNH